MKCYLNITEQGHMWTIEEAHIRAKNGFSIAQYTEEDLIAQRHSHNFFQIHYVKEGSLIHDVKDTSVVLSAGDLFVVPLMFIMNFELFPADLLSTCPLILKRIFCVKMI